MSESVTKRILKSKRFHGKYTEKRFSKELQKYKDVIVVRASDEPNVALDFNLFLDLLSTSTKWVGLTVSGDEYSIWTDLDDPDLPFGDYDFDIKTVRSTDTEIQLKLRVDGNKSISKCLSGDGQGFDLSTVDWSAFEPKKLLNAFLGAIMSIQWNWAAIKQSLEFVMVSVVYLVSEIPNMIRFVGEFTLRAFREVSNLIHVLTPLFMAVIDMLSKIFGVLFMLISDVLRSSRNNRRAPPQGAIGNQQYHQPLTYR